MVFLGVKAAVAVAGRDPDIHATVFLTRCLGHSSSSKSEPNTLQNAYAAMGWDEAIIEEKAKLVLAHRRLDLVRTQQDSLQLSVEQSNLSAQHKAALSAKLKDLYDLAYGIAMEPHSIRTFEQVLNIQLDYSHSNASKDERDRLAVEHKKHGVIFKGTVDARSKADCANKCLCEFKNRKFAEADMLDKYREPAHAQIQMYMVMLGDDDVTGYLVEHMRTGTGNTLLVELRHIPYISTGIQTPHTVSAEEAGQMVITVYTMQQAKNYVHDMRMQFKKFSRVYYSLKNFPERLSKYLAREDKKAWYDNLKK